MARSAGVSAIFAEYGCRRHSPGYSKLRRVTHWTNEDVARELLYMQQDADRTVRSFEEVVAMF